MNDKGFSIIVAMDSRRGIGLKGQLPWHLPGDMKQFKKVTCDVEKPGFSNVVIMGRKTWLSIPDKFRPLPQRVNIVITSRPASEFPREVYAFTTLSKALEALAGGSLRNFVEHIFVIGGGQLYQEAITHPECRFIYQTLIEQVFQCDTFFPSFEDQFRVVKESPLLRDRSMNFRFVKYQRISSSPPRTEKVIIH